MSSLNNLNANPVPPGAAVAGLPALAWREHAVLALMVVPPVFLAVLVGRRWAAPRFRLHRLGGLAFLCTYAYAWLRMWTDYEGCAGRWW